MKPKTIKRTYQPSQNNDYVSKIENLIEVYKEVIDSFDTLIFKIPEDENEEKYLNSKVQVKFSWMKVYAKKEFYEVKEKLIS